MEQLKELIDKEKELNVKLQQYEENDPEKYERMEADNKVSLKNIDFFIRLNDFFTFDICY